MRYVSKSPEEVLDRAVSREPSQTYASGWVLDRAGIPSLRSRAQQPTFEPVGWSAEDARLEGRPDLRQVLPDDDETVRYLGVVAGVGR